MSEELKIRKGQIITNFGVGAIVEIGDRSLMAMDISKWSHRIETKENQLQKIPRLQKALGIKYIINPPSAKKLFFQRRTPEHKQLPYNMFPKWLVCRSCKSLRYYKTMESLPWEDFKCKNCKKDYTFLGPVRFIHAPLDGYLSDINWNIQLHYSSTSGCRSWDLFLKNKPGKGSGLDALEVSCADCSIKKSVAQIKTQINEMNLQVSHGSMPWEQQTQVMHSNITDDALKKHKPFQQRGATSLYQPKIVSALDLSGTEYEEQDETSTFAILRDLDTDTLKTKIETIELYSPTEEKEEIKKREIETFVEENNRELDGSEQLTFDDVKTFIESDTEIDQQLNEVDLSQVSDSLFMVDELKLLVEDNHIVTKNYDGQKSKVFDTKLKKYISSITKIRKLREVRVLTGYTRHFYPLLHKIDRGDDPKGYLPGIEVFGEGMFLQLNIEELNNWKASNMQQITKRLETMVQRQQSSSFLPLPTPEFVLIHTFSHLLIKQLCFDSGYGATSIKERIYVDSDNNKCGVLIYTADADSEGSFGGLARMCNEKKLSHSIKNMIQTAEWCSADPTCLNIGSPGTRGLNKSACHACSLISETSCSHMNALLDRGLLVGAKEDGVVGFLENYL